MDDDNLGQDEIEELLRQASSDAAAAEPSTPEEPPEAEPAGPAMAVDPPPAATAPSAAPSASEMDADVQFLLNQAQAALRSVDAPTENNLPDLAPFQLQQLTGAPANTESASLELLNDVELDMRIELGRTHMYLEDVLQLRKGAVVPLDKLAGDPVDVYVNGRLVARGEVLVLNDNFCVRIAELISSDELD